MRWEQRLGVAFDRWRRTQPAPRLKYVTETNALSRLLGDFLAVTLMILKAYPFEFLGLDVALNFRGTPQPESFAARSDGFKKTL